MKNRDKKPLGAFPKGKKNPDAKADVFYKKKNAYIISEERE